MNRFFQQITAIAFMLASQLVAQAANCCNLSDDQATQDSQRSALADDGFVIARVQTQLQKRLLNIKASVPAPIYYLGINGNQLFGENSSSSREKLKQTLARLASENASVFVSTTYFKDLPTSEQQGNNNKTITKLIEDVELSFAGRSSSFTSNDVPQQTPRFELGLVEDPGEELIGNEEALVFTAKLPLSLYLTSNAICYVEITSLLEGEEGLLNDKIKDSISKSISKLDLEKGKPIKFKFFDVEASEGWQNNVQKEFNDFAKSLGFSSAGIEYLPNRVQLAESKALIGSKAPDFKLEDFESGEEQSLSQLGQGKFVLLNFYGNT